VHKYFIREGYGNFYQSSTVTDETSGTDAARENEREHNATARASRTRSICTKALEPIKNTPETIKTQYEQKLSLSGHNERESNTAKAQHRHENKPKTAGIERKAINPYKQ
jgi:hypothetical protein